MLEITGVVLGAVGAAGAMVAGGFGLWRAAMKRARREVEKELTTKEEENRIMRLAQVETKTIGMGAELKEQKAAVKTYTELTARLTSVVENVSARQDAEIELRAVDRKHLDDYGRLGQELSMVLEELLRQLPKAKRAIEAKRVGIRSSTRSSEGRRS